MVLVEKRTTKYDTSPPTEIADTSTSYDQNLTTHEVTKYAIKDKLSVYLEDFDEYSDSLTTEQIATRYGTTLEPLTFEFAAQLLGHDSLEELNFTSNNPGVAGSLHPPTYDDIEFFGKCRDVTIIIMNAEQDTHPEVTKEIKGKISMLNNLLSQAIEEIDTTDVTKIRSLRTALELAEERSQSFIASLDKILHGESIAMSLDELDEAGDDDPQVLIAEVSEKAPIQLMPSPNDRRTIDSYFPYKYAKRFEHLDRPEMILPGDAVRLAREIAEEAPDVADAALAGIAQNLVETAPLASLEVAQAIHAPNLKAIRLSDTLRRHPEALEPEDSEEVRDTINQLFDKVIANPDTTRRVLDIAEIAANLQDNVTTEGVKQYIAYLAQEGHGTTHINMPVEALFAAMDDTDEKTSFTKAFARRMVHVHNDVDAMRVQYAADETPPVPVEHARALARRKRLNRMRRVGTALLRRS